MSIILICLVIASFLFAITSAVVVLFRNLDSPIHRWLAAFLVFAGSWGLVINLQNPHMPIATNMWVIRATLAVATLMSYAMFHFVLAIGDVRITRPTRYLVMGATIIEVLFALSPLAVPGVRIRGSAIVSVHTLLYYSIITFILLLCTAALYFLYMAIQKARTHFAKKQFFAIFLGLLSGIILGSLTNIILPNIVGSETPARYAWIAIMVWTLSLLYTVVRHKFLDIRLAVVRTAAYVLSLVSLAVIYYILAYTISRLLLHGATSIEPINIVLAMLLAFIFQPTKRFFDQLTNRLFYRDNYDNDLFFSQLSRTLTLTTDLKDLLVRSASYIANTLKSEQAFFLVRYGEERYVSAGTRHHKKMPLYDVSTLDAYIAVHKESRSLVTELLDDQGTRRMLVSHHVAVTLPLWQNETIIGYLFLGDQLSSGYTQRDMRVIESIADELVIAIQNALSVQKIRELNDTLQQRIDSATKELRTSNEQLRRLDEAKDEFVSMASHQLRTPLTSVKGYLSMMLEGDAGEINDVQKHFLGEAFTSSERMVHLINDFLNVSRLQTGKFIIDKRKADLRAITSQEVDSLRTTAKQRQLTLRLKLQGKIPPLYVDENKIRQVIMNFIDNALYYSAAGTTILITLKAEGDRAVLSVKDTGIGVPKSEQAHLFEKFYRASNARKQRPDGTGVGLFLAKKVIIAHGGFMTFESEEGKGSTFGFSLPIKQLQHAPSEDMN